MAEIVDLAKQRVAAEQEHQEFRSKAVALALQDIAEPNERGEVRSFVGFIIDYNGQVTTTLSREFEDDIVLLGAIEIFKSDLLARMRERRQFEDTAMPEDDPA
jgi:hypothetical protein